MLNPRFHPFPAINTERLVLREIKAEDKREVFLLRSDKRVLAFLGKEPARRMQEASEYIRMIKQSVEENLSILWAISLKETPALLIGTICFWNLQKENHRAEIGYVLHPDFWQRGIMKEALNAALRYGFEELKLHSVEARLLAANKPSAFLLESAGFVKEGHLREEMYFRGNFYDTVIYSRLR